MNYSLVKNYEEELVCPCSSKHVPKPRVLAEVEVDNGRVYICPSALFNLEDLLAQYALTGGIPSGSITKHYGKVVRDLALEIYRS